MPNLATRPNVHADLVRNLPEFLVPIPIDLDETPEALKLTDPNPLNDSAHNSVGVQIASSARHG